MAAVAGSMQSSGRWRRVQRLDKIHCAPGNAGIAQLAECHAIAVNEFDKLTAFAVELKVDLVVIGPDDPLADGIVDAFEAKSIPVFGPRT